MLGKKLIFVLVILCVNCSFSQEKDSTLVALEKQVTVATNDSLKVEALLNLGIYQLRRDFNKISKYHDQISRIIEFSPAYDARSQMGQLLQQKGVYNRKKSNYTVALSRYQESQRIFLELKDSLNLSTNYHNIGVVFEYQRERVKAIDNFKKAIAINKQLHNLKKLADNYNAIADNYFYVEQLDSVQYYFDQAIKNYEFINNEEGIHQVLANQSASLTRRKKHKEALPLQLKNFEYLQTTNKKEALAESHFNLAHLYNQLKQFDKAMFHVNKAIDIAKNEKIGELLSKSYKRRSRVYYYLKDYKNALDDYRRHKKTYDTFFNLQKAKEIREIELSNQFQQERIKDSLRFENEKKLATVALEQQNQRRTLRMTIAFLIVLALVIIAYLLYRQRALRAERDAQERLIKNLELQRRVETKTEEVNELLTETIQHIKSKERIAENLQKLSNEKEGITLKSIIADLKASKADNAKLMLIKQNIEQVNFQFIKKLKTKHPKLTKTDVEICSLVRIGLSRKEVASLRNTSLDAVKMSRSRIKKKLGLNAGQSLDDYINTL